ncbi:hypothetical protein [Kribbella sindirgiensis]|uniref:Uncharacterized protein n=1 Tax=Kribbella sindirgiensis TaxID=1124744 RepID=A0A4R0JNJ5_9ACTN|nr:hypothetical protein [Kribbella sindirgiensis]TCC43525.1 hypothetical protein E0H50_03460 [Kribbella sindirgiensis]
MADTQESGEHKDGGWSRFDAQNFKAALDGVSKGDGKASAESKGEKPKTGALRDIGSALEGNDR